MIFQNKPTPIKRKINKLSHAIYIIDDMGQSCNSPKSRDIPGMFRWSKPKYLRIRNMPKHIPTL